MKILKNLSLSLLFLLPITENRVDVFDQVIAALQSGDMAKLEKHFAPNLELQLPDGRVLYKNHDEVKKELNAFLKENPAQKVQIKHRGPEGKQGFVIANYLSKTGVSYRLTIYMEGDGAKMRIKELKFENS